MSGLWSFFSCWMSTRNTKTCRLWLCTLNESSLNMTMLPVQSWCCQSHGRGHVMDLMYSFALLNRFAGFIFTHCSITTQLSSDHSCLPCDHDDDVFYLSFMSNSFRSSSTSFLPILTTDCIHDCFDTTFLCPTPWFYLFIGILITIISFLRHDHQSLLLLQSPQRTSSMTWCVE